MLAVSGGDVPASAQDQEPPARVLILYPHDEQLPASRAVAEAAVKQLVVNSPRRIELYSDFLDLDRFQGEAHRMLTGRYLAQKYAGRRPDLVLALGPQSLAFFVKHQADIAPGAAIAFCCTSSPRLEEIDPPASAVGASSEYNLVRTMELAAGLQPDARHLVVIAGASDFDRSWEARAHRDLAPLEARYRTTYLVGLPLEELLERVASLPRDTIILFLTVFEDGHGRKFQNRTVVGRVAAAASAPVYGPYGAYVGRGVVGTYSDTFERAGIVLGNLAADVLAGSARPGTRSAVDHSYIVDARELDRWSLSAADLPPGTTILFEEETLWNRYWPWIAGIGAVVAVQLLMIIALLNERRNRRRAAMSLRESEEHMALAASASDLGLWHYNVQTSDVWSTGTFRRILDLRESGEIDLDDILRHIHADEREAAQQAIDRAIETGNLCEGSYRIVRADGEIGWINTRARLSYREDGKPDRLNGVVIDVSERRAAEAAAELEHQQLLHLSRVSILGELSGAFAHELNQPLSAILSNAEAAQRLLEARPDDRAAVKEILQDIVEDDRRAGDVIRRLRALLKYGSSEFRELSPNTLVKSVLNLTHSELIRRHISVNETRSADDLPNVLGDPVQLEQVLLNLIVNGSEAMSETPPPDRILTISTRIVDDVFVGISVGDRGGGIPADIEANLFKPFMSTKDNGLGLGLAISQSIVTAHGGRIWAENAPGGGAVFSFTLPVANHAQVH